MKFNIVIIGAGEVGFNLAKSLSKEEHDITVIDIDPVKCQKITNHIDAKVIEGDGCSQRILQKIQMNEVDYLISLTRIDEVNLVASKIGKERGYDYIMDAVSGALVYALPPHDLTDEVIEELRNSTIEENNDQ